MNLEYLKVLFWSWKKYYFQYKVFCWWHHAVFHSKRSCIICKWPKSWPWHNMVGLPMEDPDPDSSKQATEVLFCCKRSSAVGILKTFRNFNPWKYLIKCIKPSFVLILITVISFSTLFSDGESRKNTISNSASCSAWCLAWFESF